jgi:hypothetical protein
MDLVICCACEIESVSDQGEGAMNIFNLLHYTRGICHLVRKQCLHAWFYAISCIVRVRKTYPQEKVFYD